MEGTQPCILVVSNKACKEFSESLVTSIERCNSRKGMSEMLTHCFVNDKTDKSTLQRRKNFSQWLGLSSSSRYIPRMIESCQEVVDKMANEEKADIMSYMNMVTFNIFTKILFGDEVDELATKLYPYENPDGATEDITLREFLIRLTREYLATLYNPICFIFPFISNYRLQSSQNLFFP